MLPAGGENQQNFSDPFHSQNSMETDDHSNQISTQSTMPRVPRAPQTESQRHNPLAEEYAPSYPFKQKASHKKRKSRSDGDNEDDHVIGTKAARKILRIGQELADEDEAQQKKLSSGAATNPAFAFDTRFGGEVESDDGDTADVDAEVWEDENEELVELEVAIKEKCRLELISS